MPLEALFDQEFQDSLLFNTTNKNPQLIIEHCKRQIELAKVDGGLPESWTRLERIVGLAEGAILNENLREACFCFYWLGQKTEFLVHWHNSADFMDYIRAQASRHAQNKGFHSKAKNQKFLRELSQSLAEKTWDQDTENRLRTNTVAEKVWNLLVDHQTILEEAGVWEYVGEHKTIRGWVSRVAPAYAQKPGRPKKAL